MIGCGLIGSRRARTIPGGRLVACADVLPERAAALAATVAGCSAYGDWKQLLAEASCDVVIVATLHDTLAEIGAAAAGSGRHVLVEKPAGRRASEVAAIAEAAGKAGVLVRVGFNHRYHRALRKARALVD
ncbi:hypothetical protein BH10PSE9_BH10PSE9_03700 [soil metagenome]